MMAEPKMPPAAIAAQPHQCAHCAGLVMGTEVGWTHIDAYGGFVGWLCPLPHMRLGLPSAPRSDAVGAPVSSPEVLTPPPTELPSPTHTRADRLTQIPPSMRGRDTEPLPPWQPLRSDAR